MFKYIQDNKLDILGQPLPLDVKELTDADEAYTFSYEVGLAPKLDLEINKDITFPYYTIVVSDEMRAEQDKMMRERLGSQQPGEEFEDKALVKGVMMELNADGTVNETATALCGSQTALGIIPAGSGNGLARHLGIPVDLNAAIDVIASGNIVASDYGTANSTPFFCTFGMGFDAAVTHRFANQNRRGLMSYVRSCRVGIYPVPPSDLHPVGQRQTADRKGIPCSRMQRIAMGQQRLYCSSKPVLQTACSTSPLFIQVHL